jgi:hypothetical protein
MHDAEFMPLRPRRQRAAAAPLASDDIEPAGELRSAPASPPHSADGPPAIVVSENDVAPNQDSSEDVSFEEEVEPAETPPAAARDPNDEEERAASLRDEAIRFASIATARALRTTLAHDAAALTRYVDDALHACGRVTRARVRLHPADAQLYRPRRDVEVIADTSAMRGQVAVETDTGTVGATIEERAALLARAAADA